MPTSARRVRNTILVDNVDFKRVAREYLKTLSSSQGSANVEPSAPASLNAAMEHVARWMGFPDLHALTVQSQAAEPQARPHGGILPEEGDDHDDRSHHLILGTSGAGAASKAVAIHEVFCLHPIAAASGAQVPASLLIGATRLAAGLNQILAYFSRMAIPMSPVDIRGLLDLRILFVILDESSKDRFTRVTGSLASIFARSEVQEFIQRLATAEPPFFGLKHYSEYSLHANALMYQGNHEKLHTQICELLEVNPTLYPRLVW